MFIRYFTSFVLLLLTHMLIGQNTVGLLSYQKDRSQDGYNLIYPHNQPNVYLLNNCGEIVHIWSDSTVYRPGNTAYITKEGKLVKTKRNRVVTNDRIWSGGGGATVEIRNWDNELEWSFTINDSIQRLHHDISVLPSGNILMIVWQLKNLEELVSAGRDTSKYDQTELYSEKIIEVDPRTNQIVWQWDVWDHLVQEHDTSKENYGNISESQGKIDINYASETGGNSWMHMNAIDYNEELDQIIVSIPAYNEIWIIDHTTTTQQAATSSGGLSGKGGDLMYRWGNPNTYQKGDVVPQSLYFQHNVSWVDDFISVSNPYYGKISVFNNRIGGDFSAVNVMTPPWDMYEWRYTMTNGAWGPINADLTKYHPEPTKLFSAGLSSVQVLSNGNLLILGGSSGYVFEITPDNQIVWEYKIPLKAGLAVEQGTSLVVNNNTTFRTYRYPVDYIGFDGKDLTSKGYIELNPDINYCNKLVATSDISSNNRVQLYPNPATQNINVLVDLDTEVKIISVEGQVVRNIQLYEGLNQINISHLAKGTYFVTNESGVIKAFTVY